MKIEWIRCPICGSKTRNKIRGDTVLKNYPLYCPKCKQEAYERQKPFRVIKIGKLYRVPKEGFDQWLNGAS
ncbi:cysteine-rich KTR domain-containing protein [Lachnospiraceae bacterium 29-84]